MTAVATKIPKSVLFFGTNTFPDARLVEHYVNTLTPEHTVVYDGCEGVGKWAAAEAKKLGIKTKLMRTGSKEILDVVEGIIVFQVPGEVEYTTVIEDARDKDLSLIVVSQHAVGFVKPRGVGKLVYDYSWGDEAGSHHVRVLDHGDDVYEVTLDQDILMGDPIYLEIKYNKLILLEEAGIKPPNSPEYAASYKSVMYVHACYNPPPETVFALI
jgi:hypothetical protein